MIGQVCIIVYTGSSLSSHDVIRNVFPIHVLLTPLLCAVCIALYPRHVPLKGI